jgi:hypothetical protein
MRASNREAVRGSPAPPFGRQVELFSEERAEAGRNRACLGSVSPLRAYWPLLG